MVYIINFGSIKTSAILKAVQALSYECTIINWTQSHEINFENAKAFILSGAPILLTEVATEAYLKKFEFIKKLKVPVLGICFGHQLLGLLYNANVFKGEAIRELTLITVVIKDNLFKGLGESIEFVEDHTEGIDLPKDFILLAYSVKYSVEAMKHKTKNIYGVQFHPEVSGGNGITLIENFLKHIR